MHWKKLLSHRQVGYPVMYCELFSFTAANTAEIPKHNLTNLEIKPVATYRVTVTV